MRKRSLVAVLAVVLGSLFTGSASADYVGMGTHPWVIVLCNFSNQQLDPAPASFFEQMYGDPGSDSGQYNFEDWWHDASFGQLSVTGTAVADGSGADANGWYTVPETRDTWGYSRDRYGKIVDCANAAASDVDYANYYGVIAIFPEAAGKTTVALNASDTTVTLDSSSSSPTPTVATTNYWPTPPFMMNIDDGTPSNSETVRVTAVSGNTFTIVRGVNGTTAQAHNANADAGVPGDFGEVTNGSPVGTPPGQSHVTLTSGTFDLATVILPNETNLSGAQHETGHGFGYSHSRKLSYSTTDYQDSTDIMSVYTGTYEYTTLGTTFGGSVLGSLANDKGPGLDAINLDFQGWIPAPRHYPFDNGVPGQDTITLHSLSDPNALLGSGYLEARSPASVTIEDQSPNGSNGQPLPPTSPPTCSGGGYACTTSSYYTLEYREQTGWDSGFPADAIVLHLFGNDNRSYWVDQLPYGHNGLLYVGDEYVDAANNTYVAVNSFDPSSHTARVTLGAQQIQPDLAYSGDTSQDYNDQTTLAADLTVGGAPVPFEPITLTLGTQSCGGTTDAAGQASCSITVDQDPGSHTVTASFTGDPAYSAASASVPYTITQEESKVVYTGALTSHYHDSATVSAQLVDPDGGAPIVGKTITFTLGVGDTCTAVTDGTGAAQCQIAPHQTGTQTLVASFGPDTDYLSSSDSVTFAITPEETTMTYTGPTVILGGSGAATLTARLVEDGANDSDGDGGSPAPVPAQTATLSLGSQSCTATSDPAGNLSCTIPSVTVPLGPETVSADFAGNAAYQPSSDSTTAIVFAFPSRGVFVVGDETVATAGSSPITWWSSMWSALNGLSGGAAPAAFKGFVNTITLPTTTPVTVCGSNWATTTGNSSSPVGTVPSYMGVVVASSIGQSGSTINGNSVGIVVLQTNPGYAPNPGHPDTGTIVATYC
jgi:Bacterial Ig-like domain (group 3)